MLNFDNKIFIQKRRHDFTLTLPLEAFEEISVSVIRQKNIQPGGNQYLKVLSHLAAESETKFVFFLSRGPFRNAGVIEHSAIKIIVRITYFRF